jgi:hypothetical protein
VLVKLFQSVGFFVLWIFVFRLHLFVRRVPVVTLAPLKSLNRMFMGLLSLAAARASSKD